MVGVQKDFLKRVGKIGARSPEFIKLDIESLYSGGYQREKKIDLVLQEKIIEKLKIIVSQKNLRSFMIFF